jgi:hypothetical protein
VLSLGRCLDVTMEPVPKIRIRSVLLVDYPDWGLCSCPPHIHVDLWNCAATVSELHYLRSVKQEEAKYGPRKSLPHGNVKMLLIIKLVFDHIRAVIAQWYGAGLRTGRSGF